MSLMTSDEFEDFFKPYAANVENFYQAAYWRLSDEVIRELMRRHLKPSPGTHLLDAGGGTGRWGAWCAKEFGIDVTVADKSAQMLREAERVRAAADLHNSLHLVRCDLEDAPELSDAAYDNVISTYGVLSFLDDPAACFRTLFRVLRPGGRGLLMSHSLATAFATKFGAEELDPDIDGLWQHRTVQWAPHVPRLRVFSGAELRDMATAAGFTVRGIFGVTAIVQPGPEDFGVPHDRKSAVSARLEDPAFFASALEAELTATEHPHWAERGTNLMVFVEREMR
ncbi:ubiquinone/menaquinone biosynthesis C-methylase UbiE [Streptomyces sp. SAI-144]|uniref:SAM-dependent methyltransferase n=1 Tax=Streptomyces sp. SAI-144 TaxID=2940544 RepID=UPI002476E327|nr:class I SAM-dependent methyltransferase [Streptomyces sp. SAI-144]MDH6435685.1 ubiquinone/menaquinone biosynthesis C-methylase UbiE [Streptomyces sp. SAI-144]